ncbi:AraC family transcriptional regulator [Paenibacillus ginsengarvi]|uniref:AraC family transcriptional regulator n=1 Tax=Paenibacillus ginsengarvi TaxID=400777 RepID=A0A3B0B1Y3_9BACL|nr:AraC family transcriptional regulator [Paenibacillus ginsengarvi]RKN66044.1 AraC family transcriptional regulator [Paenibacillus ginsengarvi]
MDGQTKQSEMAAEVLHAMYSRHEKSYHTNTNRRTFLNYYIRLQVEGQCEARIGDNETWEMIYPGDLFLFRPGDRCQLSFTPNKKTNQVLSGNYYIVCRGAWLDHWWDAAERPLKAKIALNGRLLDLCKELELEMTRTKKNWAEAAGYLLRMLLIGLDREIGVATGGTNRELAAAQRMKLYIEDRALSRPAVGEVAAHVGLSKSRASHLFTSAFGQSIVQYALDVRLNHACSLIHYSHYSLQEVADLSGFQQYSFFNRAFRKKYGVSPKQFRMQAL